MTAVPGDFAATVLEVHGVEGARWLKGLGGLIGSCSERWAIRVMPSFEPLSYNYVAPAVRADGSDVVLKLGVPDEELRAEIESLRLFGGCGIVRLLEVDEDAGALLLERLRPGTSVVGLSEEEATSAAASVMRSIRGRPPGGYPFPTVSAWASGLGRLRARFDGTGPFPTDLVERAEQLFSELIGSMGDPVLLHGDLHHDNILGAEREPWLAIDPKGVVGEPEYEVGAFLRNPMPQLLREAEPGRVLSRRVDVLSDELGYDRERLIGWGTAQAVLSGWWSYEDHGQGWEPSLACAEILAELG